MEAQQKSTTIMPRPSLAIIDLGINNVKSIEKAFQSSFEDFDTKIIGKDGLISNTPQLLVLPGVGAFGSGITRLKNLNLYDQVRDFVDSGGALVGICLGMQLLGSGSEESPNVVGLEILQGNNKKLESSKKTKVPRTGWDSVKFNPNSILQNIKSADFYFNHSYHFVTNMENVTATALHGESEISAAVQRDFIFGFQFHPEKSGKVGAALLRELSQVIWGSLK
jgi:glutamine amidotransferase